jgi:hypothetical protein
MMINVLSMDKYHKAILKLHYHYIETLAQRRFFTQSDPQFPLALEIYH